MPTAARKQPKPGAPIIRFDIDEGAHLFLRAGAKKGRWHLYAYVDGDELRQSTGTADLAVAKTVARKMLADAQERRRKGMAARPLYFPDIAELWLADHVGTERQWNAQRLTNEQIKTRQGICKQVRDYLIPYFGQYIGRRPLDELSEAHIREYSHWRDKQRVELVVKMREKVDQRIQEATARWHASERLKRLHPDINNYLPKDSLGYIRANVSTAAINKELSIFRKIMEFAVARGNVRHSDVPRIRTRSVQDGVARFGFTPEEFETIKRKAQERYGQAHDEAMQRWLDRHPSASVAEQLESTAWKADPTSWGRFVLWCVIDILAGTGMRPSTLANLKMRMVQPREHDQESAFATEYMRISDCGYKLVGFTHKGVRREADRRRMRTIIPDASAWQAIKRLSNARNGDDDQPLIDVHPHSINTAFKKVLRACGLEIGPNDMPRSLYDLRHYYITQKLLEGVPQMVVAENTLTSIQMIEQYYAHIRAEANFDRLAGGAALRRRRERGGG